jgi:hypothetical protein
MKQKEMSCFHAYGQVSQRLKKKSYHIFIQKNSKKYMVTMHFGFNNQFIKVMRTRPIFQKYPKNILFSFTIWDYEFIRKAYF